MSASKTAAREAQRNAITLLQALTAGELGIIGVCIDDNDHLGDDDLTSRIEAICIDEDIDSAQDIAYAIVHYNGRTVEGL